MFSSNDSIVLSENQSIHSNQNNVQPENSSIKKSGLAEVVACLTRSFQGCFKRSNANSPPVTAALSIAEINVQLAEENLTTPSHELFIEVNTYSRTALHFAVRNGSLDVVNRLLEADTDINAADDYGETALHYASRNGLLDVANRLLEAGADINAVNNEGKTALHYTAKNGTLKFLNRLLEAGANINAADNHGHTTLHFSAIWNCLDFVNCLLESGADINAVNNEGKTVLHFAARNVSHNIINLLLEAGSEINSADNYGESALHSAARNAALEFINRLLKAGSDLNAVNSEGKTALHFAVCSGSLDVVNALLEGAANINAADNRGRTALHFAVRNGSLPVITRLLEAGISVNETNLRRNFMSRNMSPTLRQIVIEPIAENRLNQNLDLRKQFPTMINEDDFKQAITTRRTLIVAELSNQVTEITDHLTQEANDQQSLVSSKEIDLFSLISHYALSYPTENLGSLMFPDVQEHQRDEAVTKFFNGTLQNNVMR